MAAKSHQYSFASPPNWSSTWSLSISCWLWVQLSLTNNTCGLLAWPIPLASQSTRLAQHSGFFDWWMKISKLTARWTCRLETIYSCKMLKWSCCCYGQTYQNLICSMSSFLFCTNFLPIASNANCPTSLDILSPLPSTSLLHFHKSSSGLSTIEL